MGSYDHSLEKCLLGSADIQKFTGHLNFTPCYMNMGRIRSRSLCQFLGFPTAFTYRWWSRYLPFTQQLGVASQKMYVWTYYESSQHSLTRNHIVTVTKVISKMTTSIKLKSLITFDRTESSWAASSSIELWIQIIIELCVNVTVIRTQIPEWPVFFWCLNVALSLLIFKNVGVRTLGLILTPSHGKTSLNFVPLSYKFRNAV